MSLPSQTIASIGASQRLPEADNAIVIDDGPLEDVQPQNPALEKSQNVPVDVADDEASGLVPTEEDLRTLRRVSDKIPLSIYTITFIEFCERFSYYGSVTVLTNFMQWPLPKGSATGAAPHGQPGALGLGQRAATGLTTFNTFWQYTMPLLGAYVADTHWGRFRTIAAALAVGIVGHVVLIAAGLPPVLADNAGHARGGAGATAALVLGLLTLGVGTGGFKPNITPLVAEQVTVTGPRGGRMFVKTMPDTGERVIVDPAVTVSRIYHYFYLCINVGALCGQFGMVFAEKYVGFWLSFLLPTVMLCVCPLVLWWGRRRYVRRPPEGSVLSKALRLFARANAGRWSWNPVATYRRLHDGTFWARVKPSAMAPAQRPSWMTFDDAWVDEVRRGFHACGVFLWMPFFWVCYNQMTNNLVSMASVMKLNNVPNDILANINPLTLIVMLPILNDAVYPLMRRLRIRFTPIKKIAAGYFVASIAMVWAAVLQRTIYQRSECGTHASGWKDNGERCAPADVSVWAQTGCFVLTALAEVLANTTCLEYAQSKAPQNMRSMVQALSLFTNAVSSALGFAFVSLSADPYLVWNYSVVAGLAALGGLCFYLNFRGLDEEEDRLNMLPCGVVDGVAAKGEEARDMA